MNEAKISKLIETFNKTITQEIVSKVYDKLNNEDMWFTTKQDPTFSEPPYYYSLDKYGYLTPEGENMLSKQVQSYIGNGAIDIDGSIDLWCTECLSDCVIDYTSNLVTKFEPKQVVDQIDAYQAKLTESFTKDDVKRISGYAKPIITNTIIHSGPINFGVTPNVYTELNDTVITIKYTLLDNKTNPVTLLDTCDAISFALNDTVKPKFGKINNISCYVDEDDKGVRYICVQLFEDTNIVDVSNLTDNKHLKTENAKQRLQEENTKSSELLASVMQSPDFDSESNQGKLVMRASKVFSVLSQQGLDVIVSVDNGECELNVVLGNSGGKVIITITNTNSPITPYSSGNYVLNTDTIKLLDKIVNTVESI